eukprot:11740779-Alexandrium_andersonii.AAC.1
MPLPDPPASAAPRLTCRTPVATAAALARGVPSTNRPTEDRGVPNWQSPWLHWILRRLSASRQCPSAGGGVEARSRLAPLAACEAPSGGGQGGPEPRTSPRGAGSMPSRLPRPPGEGAAKRLRGRR